MMGGDACVALVGVCRACVALVGVCRASLALVASLFDLPRMRLLVRSQTKMKWLVMGSLKILPL